MTHQTSNTPQHRTRYDEHTGQRITEESSDGSNWQVVEVSSTDIRDAIIAAAAFNTKHISQYEPGMKNLIIDVDMLVEQIAALIEADKAAAELYGRLHQTIELFQSGALSAEHYSKIHGQLTERISQLQGGKSDD